MASHTLAEHFLSSHRGALPRASSAALGGALDDLEVPNFGLCLVGAGALLMIEGGAVFLALVGWVLIAAGICKAATGVRDLAASGFDDLVQRTLQSL